jgi:uncharacterized protein YjlB
MLVYRDAVAADAEAIEALFARNGWPPAWRDGIHPFHRFHSAAHEALGVARGRARVCSAARRGGCCRPGSALLPGCLPRPADRRRLSA